MKKPILVVFSLLAAVLFLFVAGSKVTQAKELTTQVKITQAKLDGDQISYHWEIGTGVEIGDTFKISMPEDVKFASSAFNSMKNEKGEEIATGKVSDDGKTLTITFVKGGNKGAEGNVSFYYKWDKDNTTGKDQERTIKIGTESVIVKRSGQGPVPLLLPIKKYNSGATDNTNLQHAQKIWGPTGIPDWRDTLTVTDEQADGFLTWHISVNNAVDKQAPASSIVFTDQMPNLPALDFSRIKSTKGQDVAQYFKGGTYLPASFDLKVNGKTFVANGIPMAGLGLEPYIEWTEHGFKLDLTKISDQFKNASTDEITLSYQTLLQHADQIKSVTNVASLKSDQHQESVSKENTWVNKAASADAKVFNSEPTISPVSANLVVKKAFEVAGDQEHKQVPITEGQFEFVLKDENNTVVETAKNKADGTVNFKSLTFNKEGSYTYTITENKGTDATINYSTQSITATVDVKKENDKLVATVTYSGGDAEKGDTFTNTKTPPTPVPPTVKPTSAQFKAKKVLAINGSSDRTLKANEFTFLLKDQAGTLIDTKTNGENGDILFNPVSFNEAGTFTYTIVEQKPATPESAITYDETVHTVTVTVTKDENGQLNADVQYDGKKDTPTFTNTYTPPTPPTPSEKQITTSKILEGRDLQGGEFSFNLLDENGTVLQTKQNAADGTVTFDAIAYTEAMIGTHKYTIKEVVPADKANIQYDEGQVDVTVTVTKDEASNAIQAVVAYGDKKTFINKVIPPTPPTIDIPELKLYTLKVRKVDEKGNYLAGAVFGLFEADGVTPVANPYGEGQATATSDANGLVSFVGFEAKDYVIKELTAPAGYQLSTDVITVSASELKAAPNLVVDKGTVVNYLTPPNTPPTPPTPPTTPPTPPTPPTTPSTDKPKGDKPSGSQPKEEKKHTLPSTGETVSEGLVAAGLALAVAGSALVYKKREN